MITDLPTLLRYFDRFHQRTVRDIEALPPAAEFWRPPRGEGEKAWSIAEIVHHIAESRLYFASAYCNRGWLYDWPVPSTERQSGWIPAIEASFEEFHRRLRQPPGLAQRRLIDTDGIQRLAR